MNADLTPSLIPHASTEQLSEWAGSPDESRHAFRFVVVEVEPPHAVSVLRLGPDAALLARKKVDYALEVWARCLKSGRWPGYSSREASAQLPAYEESRWLDIELAAEDEKGRVSP